jgi:cell shape-determining protein MreC
MLELELEQCRTSYQREYEKTQERVIQLEEENIELCKSIDENTIDDSMKQQISSVINENLVCFTILFIYIQLFYLRNFINKFK